MTPYPHTIGVVIHQKLRRQLFDAADLERLETLAPVRTTPAEDPIGLEDAVALLQGCTIGVGSWGTPYPSEALLAACPQLRLWEHVAGSVKSMFGPHLQDHPLTIASCAPANGFNVAELSLAYIILAMRQALPRSRALRRGQREPSPAPTLYRQTVGVVGASVIGRMVLELLRPFGCAPLVFDPYLSATEAASLGAEKVKDLTTLFCRCRVVSLHTPHTAETKGMVGREQLRALPDGGCFINTARGGCVDEEALVAELETGRIEAMLDVIQDERNAAQNPLAQLDNVLLTPHLAGPASLRMGAQAVADIAAFIAGGNPQKVFTAEMLHRSA